jgi:uncharacterized membrane protein
MSAVAVRENVASSQSVQQLTPEYRHVLVRRRRSRNLIRLTPWGVCLATLIALIYICTYAGVTALAYHNANLTVRCRAQSIENERLRVAITRRSSPEYIAHAAQKAGMTCAACYEYLNFAQAVARSR